MVLSVILITLITLWLIGGVLAFALCRSAARGDGELARRALDAAALAPAHLVGRTRRLPLTRRRTVRSGVGTRA